MIYKHSSYINHQSFCFSYILIIRVYKTCIKQAEYYMTKMELKTNLKFRHAFFQLLFQCSAVTLFEAHETLSLKSIPHKRLKIQDVSYTVVAVLERSTLEPFPHPGFCLLARFYAICNKIQSVLLLRKGRFKKINTFRKEGGIQNFLFYCFAAKYII